MKNSIEKQSLNQCYEEEHDDSESYDCLEDRMERLYEAADRLRDERRDKQAEKFNNNQQKEKDND